MSLVENCARRQHSPIELMREIGNLRKRGYTDRQIAIKIGITADYVGMIAGLLDRGEERLVSAVESGLLPLNLAIEISKTNAEGAQRALMDAYWRRGLDISAATMDIPMAWIYAVVPVAFALLILVGVELVARLLLHLAGRPSGIVMEGAMPAVAED